MCRPHCWQYAKPIGVDVLQRGQLIVLPCGTRDGPEGAAIAAGGGIAICGGIPAGPDGDIIGAPIAGGGIIGAPIIGAPIAGDPGVVCASAAPHCRQNFIPGGFSPRHTPQIVGNPRPGAGVCATGASALPQFRQNADPGGLS